MKLPLLLAALFMAASLQAQTPAFDYASALALAKERGKSQDPRQQNQKSVYVLGPRETEEFTVQQGKETRTVVPYCMTFNFDQNRTMESLLARVGFGQGDFQAWVYRAGTPGPILRLKGSEGQLRSSQFPLQTEDIVVIKVEESKKKN